MAFSGTACLMRIYSSIAQQIDASLSHNQIAALEQIDAFRIENVTYYTETRLLSYTLRVSKSLCEELLLDYKVFRRIKVTLPDHYDQDEVLEANHLLKNLNLQIKIK